MIETNLPAGYGIRTMTPEEFDPLFRHHTQRVFDDETQVFRMRETLTETEREKLQGLAGGMGKPFELRLGVFHDGEFVGWHYGRQDSYASFYMQNSAILPAHRRRGLYAALMAQVVRLATEAGFQDVWSRHNATNNAVIIPKLKRGFLITALELSDTFGTLIHLHYYPKEARRRMMDYRAGQIKPDAEIKKLLGI